MLKTNRSMLIFIIDDNFSDALGYVASLIDDNYLSCDDLLSITHHAQARMLQLGLLIHPDHMTKLALKAASDGRTNY